MKGGKLDMMISDWLGGLTCVDASKDTYLRVFRSWNRWLLLKKHYNALGATRADIDEYRSYLISSRRSSHTICNYLSVLRMFYRFAYLRADIRSNVAAGLRGVKRQKYYNKRPLTDEQVRDIFSCLDVSTATGIRDRAILMLMIRAGLRCCEVARLDLCDIIAVSGTAALRLRRKGHLSKDMTIPIADDLRDALDDYLPTRRAAKRSDPLFVSYNRSTEEQRRIRPADVALVAKRRMRTAGIGGEGISAHSLRHTFGCQLVDAGVPMSQIQLLMGHNSIDATMIYVKMSADRELYADNPANKIKLLPNDK